MKIKINKLINEQIAKSKALRMKVFCIRTIKLTLMMTVQKQNVQDLFSLLN